MFDTQTFPWAYLLPVEGYLWLARSARYQAIEYFPNRLIASTQGRTRLISAYARKGINSTHMSFRSEIGLRDILNHPRRKDAFFASLILPEKFASIAHLKHLSNAAKWAVVYAPKIHSDEAGMLSEFHSLPNKLIQPQPEHLEEWNVTTPEKYLYWVTEVFGCEGVCLDLTHLRRYPTQGKTKFFENWRMWLEAFLPYTKEVHISVGRKDFQVPFDSVGELRDLYFGRNDTGIFDLIHQIRQQCDVLVTEISPSAIKRVMGITHPFLMPWELVEGHKHVVQHLSQ